MVTLNRIYTRTGDDGSTGLVGGARARKNAARVEAYGDVDELNSCIGVLLAELPAGAGAGDAAAQIRAALEAKALDERLRAREFHRIETWRNRLLAEGDAAIEIRRVAKIDGIERIRFTSPHPKDLRPETIAAMAEVPAVCEHLHLPLQSGSDRVLAEGLTLTVPKTGAEMFPGNNAIEAPLSVRKEQLRVLLLESFPRWEYRYLRNALEPGEIVTEVQLRVPLIAGGTDDIPAEGGRIGQAAADAVFCPAGRRDAAEDDAEVAHPVGSPEVVEHEHPQHVEGADHDDRAERDEDEAGSAGVGDREHGQPHDQRRDQRKQKVDAMAAAILLQSYLDSGA